MNARELILRHQVRYEVSPYFLVAPKQKIQAGFDLDLYGKGLDQNSALSFENGDLRDTLNDLAAACRELVPSPAEGCIIEIIPSEATLYLNVKRHLDPEASVRIRITHSRGLEEPAGANEEKALADVMHGLDSLGVKRT